MADRDEYVPKLNDRVTMEGAEGVFVVVGVDFRERLARVGTHVSPVLLYTVPWSKLSYFDKS